MMLSENIDKLIMESMKNHDSVRTESLRAIKSAFIEARTAKNAKPLDEVIEIQVMQKMVKQREDSIEKYESCNRKDLADKERDEINIINEFLPKPITKEEIEEFVKEDIKTYDDPKKNFGNIMKHTKEKYPTADGKLISEIVKNYV